MKASFAALRQEIAEALGLPVDHIGVMHRDLPGNLNWNVSGVRLELPKPLLFNAARFAGPRESAEDARSGRVDALD